MKYDRRKKKKKLYTRLYGESLNALVAQEMSIRAEKRLFEIARARVVSADGKVAYATDTHSCVGVTHLVQFEFTVVFLILLVVPVFGRIH